MKTLILLRHARAGRPDGVKDFDRDLTDRGRTDAARAGEVLLERRLVPDVIVTSTARRAHRTAERMMDAAGFDTPLIATRELYEADGEDILDVVTSLPADSSLALLVGHNPEFLEFLMAFIPSIESLPKGAWAQLDFDVSTWDEITEASPVRLIEFWSPKVS